MNPSQRQIIPLQSRPYENDPVSGTLTVEVYKPYAIFKNSFANFPLN